MCCGAYEVCCTYVRVSSTFGMAVFTNSGFSYLLSHLLIMYMNHKEMTHMNCHALLVGDRKYLCQFCVMHTRGFDDYRIIFLNIWGGYLEELPWYKGDSCKCTHLWLYGEKIYLELQNKSGYQVNIISYSFT